MQGPLGPGSVWIGLAGVRSEYECERERESERVVNDATKSPPVPSWDAEGKITEQAGQKRNREGEKAITTVIQIP
jgi:hypothetical protein